ncbi:membrane protein insertion efficiency factor YidD [Streptomyces sp. SP18CS02]|uniref:membrane protein insertion efficiency factor YidD n=1 Tax=Streptomyces sp. SP18CS02 TaxID=3002531 RepID=UPI002E7925DE|nr:membrane protein insertion efficiency factor YidD [Streptomyces sp. SP18CS02]MEE1753093.1 membrane protein insertion efficiency factor YidD [Streptomyces sp. SP18CS02]
MARSGEHARRGNAAGEEREGCCATTLDTLTHPCCCGGVGIQAALLLAVLRPSLTTVGHGADPVAPPPGGRVAAAMYRSIRHYRVAISPTRPPCCPYTPSCSTYAVQALHRHGALRGGRLVLARLLRCRPGAARRRDFRDPVPPGRS